ncbi:hypothetical protein P3L10_003482 [Capsicum annuum]
MAVEVRSVAIAGAAKTLAREGRRRRGMTGDGKDSVDDFVIGFLREERNRERKMRDERRGSGGCCEEIRV